LGQFCQFIWAIFFRKSAPKRGKFSQSGHTGKQSPTRRKSGQSGRPADGYIAAEAKQKQKPVRNRDFLADAAFPSFLYWKMPNWCAGKRVNPNKTGIDVMILKIFSLKNSAKKLAFLT
jgi:hypothetical protein